jgi:hypothetical protein
MKLLQTQTCRDSQSYILDDHGEHAVACPDIESNNYRCQLGAMLDPDLMSGHVNLLRTAMPKIEESKRGIVG